MLIDTKLVIGHGWFVVMCKCIEFAFLRREYILKQPITCEDYLIDW